MKNEKLVNGVYLRDLNVMREIKSKTMVCESPSGRVIYVND